MDYIYAVRDLHEYMNSLIHEAEEGRSTLVIKGERPIFLVVPFNEEILELGLRSALAVNLY